MKPILLAAASALALAALPTPATAQMNMPRMTMPMPAKPVAKKPVANNKAVSKKAPAKTRKAVAIRKPATGSLGGAHRGHVSKSKEPLPMEGMAMPMDHGATPSAGETTPLDHSQQSHGAMPMTAPRPRAEAPMSEMDHSQMDHSQMNVPMNDRAMAMTGALGPYRVERESSGTSWQPDASEHEGLHITRGDWMIMAHGVVNLVYDHQSGPRGDDETFASGMLMGMARHPLGHGTLQFKAMVSPDPLMGRSGYPLLLASGETANGRDRLIDRQHPHDFFMELSASASQNLGPNSSVFLYAGLPGEPAFGPPAFMHREAIMDSPEAPISHHWLDSTHISFGVVTAGLVVGDFKAEMSRFNGREPDQHRWDIETGPFDSTAARLSWNPTRTLALQGSWGRFIDPEQLEPGVDQTRWSASALWANEIAPGWKMATTLAWGRKTVDHHHDDAYVAEASVRHSGWTLFGRAELIDNRELIQAGVGPAYRVGKVSAGAVRDFGLTEHLSFGAGGLVSVNFVPDGLSSAYGGNSPLGAMAFARLKLH